MTHKTISVSVRNEWIVLGFMVAAVGGGWSLAGNDLAVDLHDNLQTNTLASFNKAKGLIYNDIDLEPNNRVTCVYSGTQVTLENGTGTLKPRQQDGVQVEHTWASLANWAPEEEKFDRDSIPGADLHHLYPVRRGINGSRGNLPFGELPDTARELRIDTDGTLSTTGTATGSFRDKNSFGVTVFEPRDEHKGNVARAMFYMSIRYWWAIPDDMENDLRSWHEFDPVDTAEIVRNGRVEDTQQNRNPFIDEPELVALIEDF